MRHTFPSALEPRSLLRIAGSGIASMVLAAAAFAQTLAVDLNTATVEQLATALSGIGAAKAQAIVEYRDTYGAFATVDDLIDVPGIGLRTLERNRDALRVGAPGETVADGESQAALTQ